MIMLPSWYVYQLELIIAMVSSSFNGTYDSNVQLAHDFLKKLH